MDPFWGKYRGIVVDTVDPLMLGRLQVSVPQVRGEVLTGCWAMPCVPYAGLQVGFCMTPPVGAAVWIEFEGGDLDYPIWTGCFWREGERPPEVALPTRQMIRTGSATLMLDDTPGEGGFALTVTGPAVAVPVRIRADSEGLTIECGGARLTLADAGGIQLTHGAAAVGIDDPLVTISSGEGALP
ncbi:phage baseplate assembly protein V [Sphingomonas koreensis]